LKPELIDRVSPRAPRIWAEQNKTAVIQSSFDRLLSGRYYNSATKMNSNYLDYYGPLLLMFILSCGLAGVLVLASAIIGKHKRSREKDQPYECGMRPTGDARQPISVQFYMVGLLFILFDIEAIFLYPWALIYGDLKVFGFVEMLLYIIILLAGYIFLWKKGALDWTH
jgi:NADH-quinone oxidoreductase subunit A